MMMMIVIHRQPNPHSVDVLHRYRGCEGKGNAVISVSQRWPPITRRGRSCTCSAAGFFLSVCDSLQRCLPVYRSTNHCYTPNRCRYLLAILICSLLTSYTEYTRAIMILSNRVSHNGSDIKHRMRKSSAGVTYDSRGGSRNLSRLDGGNEVYYSNFYSIFR